MGDFIFCHECKKEHLKAGANGAFVIVDGPNEVGLQDALFRGWDESSRKQIVFQIESGTRVSAIVNTVKRPTFYHRLKEATYILKGSVFYEGKVTAYAFKAVYSPRSRQGEISF